MYLSIYLSDCLSVRPFGNYSGALSDPGENEGFKELVKRTGQIPRKRSELRWEIVPSRGTHNREGPMLFNDRASKRYHEITSGGLSTYLIVVFPFW